MNLSFITNIIIHGIVWSFTLTLTTPLINIPQVTQILSNPSLRHEQSQSINFAFDCSTKEYYHCSFKLVQSQSKITNILMICTFTLHNHCLFGWLLNFSTIILMSKSSNKLWFEFQMKLYHRLITLSLTGRLDLEQSCLKLDLSQILFGLFKGIGSSSMQILVLIQRGLSR